MKEILKLVFIITALAAFIISCMGIVASLFYAIWNPNLFAAQLIGTFVLAFFISGVAIAIANKILD